MSHEHPVIIWDLHGVFTQSLQDRSFASRVGLTADLWATISTKLLVQEHAWDRLERGEITLDAFGERLSEMVNAAGGKCSVELAGTIWGAPTPFGSNPMDHVRWEMVSLASRIAQCTLSCLFTNNIIEWRPIWQAMIPVDSLFHHVFESCVLGHRKPDFEAFSAVERSLAIANPTIVFVDDNLHNIASAKSYGWQGIHFDGDMCALTEQLQIFFPYYLRQTELENRSFPEGWEVARDAIPRLPMPAANRTP